MKHYLQIKSSCFLLFLVVLLVPFILSGCNKGTAGGRSPEEVYTDCKAIFKKKGDPMGMSEAMCTSMKEACEGEPSGKKCQKANRMIDRG